MSYRDLDGFYREDPRRGRDAGDPHWTRARYPGNCRLCRAPIARGERVFY
jgi:hypothetical protein